MNFNFAFLYLKYYFTAGTKHDVHSPFVYELVTKVIRNGQTDEIDEIESVRKKLLHNKSVLNTEVFGARSINGKRISMPLNRVTRNSSKNKKYCSLLYRIVKFYQPAVMLELGTAVGMSAMYIAKGNPAGLLYTIEGSNAIAAIEIGRAHV